MGSGIQANLYLTVLDPDRIGSDRRRRGRGHYLPGGDVEPGTMTRTLDDPAVQVAETQDAAFMGAHVPDGVYAPTHVAYQDVLTWLESDPCGLSRRDLFEGRYFHIFQFHA